MKQKIRIFFITILSVLLFAQCEFLDIVPDNTIEVESLFQNREQALRALSSVYRYMPNFEDIHTSMNLAGDEWVGRLDPSQADGPGNQRGIRLMRGLNNSGSPILNFWGDGNGARGLYRGIRMANIFLQHIDNVPDLSAAELADWRAQVRFLKAYYHFWLIRLYGPIVISDFNLEPYSPVEEVRQKRQTIDASFEYVLGVMNEVIASNALPPRRITTLYGQIDQQVAKAVRAQVKLTRASPLFNGNSQFFGNFRNIDGELFFPMEYRPSLWREALEAIEEAIEFAHRNGRELFRFDGTLPFWDVDDFQHSDIMQYTYNLRFSIVEPWNNEIVWGFSGIRFDSQGAFAHASNIRSREHPNRPEYAWQWLGANFRMTEVFHTRNGLPIGDDITFPYTDRFELTTIPSDSWHRGHMQPGRTTVHLHLNREPRFYAWLAVDGSIFRTHGLRNNIGMIFNEFTTSGGSQLGSRGPGHPTDFFWTGIPVQKQVHPESDTGHWVRVVRHTPAIIRLADLYLMLAEAYNEYHGPGQRAFDKIDAVRARAGLRGVQATWSDPTIASPRVLNSHLTREGFREIIHREREIELSFEGHRFFDVLRWRKAGQYFNAPVRGWNTTGTNAQQFYILQTLQERVWQTPRDYLMPISLTELNRNPNLVQNPGW